MMYPWLKATDAQWLIARQQRASGHAYLVTAPYPLGELELVWSWVRWLLCPHKLPDFDMQGVVQNAVVMPPCGVCASCDWLQVLPDCNIADSLDVISPHPDVMLLIAPKIDDIRRYQAWLSLSSHQGGEKIIIVLQTEQMNAAAANALLKTLEEPPPNTLFFLLTNHPDRLLPTIRSRCVHVPIRLHATDQAMVVAWMVAQTAETAAPLTTQQATMALAEWRSPLLALRQQHLTERDAFHPELRQQLLKSLVNLAKPVLSTTGVAMVLDQLCERLGKTVVISDVLSLLCKWTFDLQRAQHGVATYFFTEARQQQLMQQIAQHVQPIQLLGFLTLLSQQQAIRHHPLQQKTWVMTLLLAYRRIFQP